MGGVRLRRVAARLSTGHFIRGAAVAMLAAGVAACSADTSRFNANPFGGNETTGSVAPAPAPARGVPVAKVETRPAYASQPLPPPSGGHQALTNTADVTGSSSPHKKTNWEWNGGTPVIVAQGETVDSMALRYNVPGTAIVQANNLHEGAVLKPGQQIVIPKMKYASLRGSVAPTAAAPASIPAHKSVGGTTITHAVAPGETLMSISRHYNKPVREIVAANRLTYDARLKVGEKITVPGVAATAAVAKPVIVAAAKAPAPAPAPVAAAKAAPQKVASIEPAATARLASPNVDTGDTSASIGKGGAPQFRWPVRGRVISGFGPIPNGQQNDGINLAVPEGTQVRAAEDGTVAYAGNELKGYGNLVLVRHADGFVTAYAHASELMVKRGDTVRRGQVIAKSGQTGTVTAPQLHFEIRKGSSPVDPTKYLPGA
jgi:murein DD-endopeptidase MepM/ murein hydrolase activator NlpD